MFKETVRDIFIFQDSFGSGQWFSFLCIFQEKEDEKKNDAVKVCIRFILHQITKTH